MTKKKKAVKKASKTKLKAPAEKPLGRKKTAKRNPPKGFPVIGLGASAGGLNALKSFFKEVPVDSCMAYIVVVHMTPNQPSMMPELLGKIASIPVTSAKDGQAIAPNRVYIIPPNKEMSLYKGKIQLLDSPAKGAPLPIDFFLRSLALDQESNAVAVILSGTGSDGTQGVKEIKASHGLVLVQSKESAEYDGMPASVMNTGLADMIMRPQEMPANLALYFGHRQKLSTFDTVGDAYEGELGWLDKIFAILRAHVGHDFSAYKVNTIIRRVTRRMGLNQIDNHATYIRFLRDNPNEVDALFKELLIGVTSFFRDQESFDALKKDVLPNVLKQAAEGTNFRVWVPGCSTGEEVYSLAIVLLECMEMLPIRISLQLFGTDIDSHAIEKAREGLFPASIAADVSEERLKRFFEKEGEFFRVKKEVRDTAIFSVQDIIKDPPFSRLDLLCCRNLLIYLDSSAQKRLLPLFHYTLKPGGILVLGSSETIGGFSSLFETLEKKWKIFQRMEVPQALHQHVDFPSGTPIVKKADEPAPTVNAAPKTNLGNVTRKLILEEYAPTAILIDTEGSILHIQGRTGKYLESTSGPPTQNILDLAREGLQIELSSAMRAAKISKKPVRRHRVAVKSNGDIQLIDLLVAPQEYPKEIAGRLLVVFRDVADELLASDTNQPKPESIKSDVSRIAKLERELQITREGHQITIEELESSNEELKSTNEEMQSSNEELQSTNEELESSKEELQSLNEELQTVNAELQSKVEELSAAHDDMRNLLNSTDVATIFVDNNMRLKRFTPKATEIINLIQTDIGRPLKHVVTNLEYPGTLSDLEEVLTHLSPKEVEVQTTEGRWYSMRILPYRTIDNRIDGAVLTFANIDDQKKAQEILRTANIDMENAWQLVRNVFDMNHNPLVVVDNNGEISIANRAYTDIMQAPVAEIEGKNVLKGGGALSASKTALAKLTAAIKRKHAFSDLPVRIDTHTGKRNYLISGTKIVTDGKSAYKTLLSLVATP